MKYSYIVNLNSKFKDVEEKVREVLMDVGFGILTEINIKDAFKSKLNINYKRYKILGACNPKLAHEALSFEPFVGILMPCNILIIDNEDGSIKVVFPKAENILKITNDDKILKLSLLVDELLQLAFKKLSQ